MTAEHVERHPNLYPSRQKICDVFAALANGASADVVTGLVDMSRDEFFMSLVPGGAMCGLRSDRVVANQSHQPHGCWLKRCWSKGQRIIPHWRHEMIKILSDSEPGTLSVSISGKLAHDDYATLESELQLRADRDGDFNLVVELSDIDGLEASAIRDDLMFAKKYSGDIDKMAVVTSDEPWSALTTFVGQPLAGLLGVEVRRFDDSVGAWKWLSDESTSSN